MGAHNLFHLVILFIAALHLCSSFLHANPDYGSQLVTVPSFALPESIDHVTFVPLDKWYTGQNVSYGNEVIWLNPDPRQAQTRAASNIGKIIYSNKVQFKYARHGMISFESSFTFQFITTNPYPNCGSGMVFFVADYYQAPERSYGRYFGLVNETDSFQFFAIEFDTHQTVEFDDPSASHIGIDISSLKSLKSVDSQPNASLPFYPELYLYNNKTFTAWVKYDAQTTLIEVWMNSTDLSQKPASPCLSLPYNLSDVFQDYMFVGFAATSNASEDSMEGLALSAWNFTVYPPSRAHKIKKPLVSLLVAICGLAILCVFSILYKISKAIKKRKCKVDDQEQSLQMKSASRAFVEHLISNTALKEYSFKDLMLASQNFSKCNEVGEGTFCRVYKATLSDGTVIAIKRLKAGCRKEEEFSAEIRVIGNIRHKNLLRLRGWCYDKGEALLIYDYMRRGALGGYLFGKDRGTLSSEVRLDILAGVAAALEYLHEHLGDCVLHRDVKASNIMLTEDWKPLLGDFGLARLIQHSENSVDMTAAGSPGYMAPEMVLTNKVTRKADVYSFGVLLLVVASGRRPFLPSTSNRSEPSELRLVDWIWSLHESSQILEALDPAMAKDMAEEEKAQWRRALHIALACVDQLPKLRPTMRQVCQALQGEDFRWVQSPPATRPNHCMSGLQSVCQARHWTGADARMGSCTSNCQMCSATFGRSESCEGR